MSLGIAIGASAAGAAGVLAWLLAERKKRDLLRIDRARSGAKEVLDSGVWISDNDAAEWLRRQGWEFEFNNSGPEVIADLARGVASCARSGTSTSKQALPADWLERAKAGTDESGQQTLRRSLGAQPRISVRHALLFFEKQSIQEVAEMRREGLRVSYEAGEAAADRLAARIARLRRKAKSAEQTTRTGT